MTDIFDAKIMCKNCNREMKPVFVNRNGFELRAVECVNCKDKIIHPADLNGMEHFKDIKDKRFDVKLRMVGNSHAVSIPKEMIDFMSERHKDMRKQMNDMVRMWFDDFDTIKLSFNGEMEDGLNGVEDQDVDEITPDGGRVRRRVRNDGRGNVDVVEEQTLDDGNGVRKIHIRKIRRISK